MCGVDTSIILLANLQSADHNLRVCVYLEHPVCISTRRSLNIFMKRVLLLPLISLGIDYAAGGLEKWQSSIHS